MWETGRHQHSRVLQGGLYSCGSASDVRTRPRSSRRTCTYWMRTRASTTAARSLSMRYAGPYVIRLLVEAHIGSSLCNTWRVLRLTTWTNRRWACIFWLRGTFPRHGKPIGRAALGHALSDQLPWLVVKAAQPVVQKLLPREVMNQELLGRYMCDLGSVGVHLSGGNGLQFVKDLAIFEVPCAAAACQEEQGDRSAASR